MNADRPSERRGPRATAAFVLGCSMVVAGLFALAAVSEGDLLAWRLDRMRESAAAPDWIKENRKEDLYFAFGGSVEGVVWALRAWCEPTLMVAVCAAMFALETGRCRYAAVMQVVTAMLFLFVAAEAVKLGLPRTRPILFAGGDPWPGSWLQPPDPSLTNYQRRSFPSSHAAAGLALSAVLFRLYPRLWWVVIPLGIGGAATRFLTLSHWPTDIIVGGAIGWLSGLAACQVLRPMWESESASEIPPAAMPVRPPAAPVPATGPARAPAEVRDPGI